MGTDIHAVFQKKSGDKWEDVRSKYEGHRSYALFAHLAGVRNGTGFAGVITGQAVKPISEPRGLPDDISMDEDFYMHGRDEVWLGDHSHSWLTADEILNHAYGSEWKTGIMRLANFMSWDGISSPDQYSGGVWGAGVVIAENPCQIKEETTHVRVFWRATSDQFDYFLDEVKRLKDEHGEIRMVFGFDS